MLLLNHERMVKMKYFFKKAICIVAALTLFICPASQVSASGQEQQNSGILDKGNVTTIMNTEMSFYIYDKGITITGRKVEETEVEGYIIKSIDTTYALNDASMSDDVQNMERAAYESEFYTKQFDITHKASEKHVLNVLLDATFKYNETYAYVSDKFATYTVYNDAAFDNISTSYTKSDRKGKVAILKLTGNLKFSWNGKNSNEKLYFQISCTKDGNLSSSYGKVS